MTPTDILFPCLSHCGFAVGMTALLPSAAVLSSLTFLHDVLPSDALFKLPFIRIVAVLVVVGVRLDSDSVLSPSQNPTLSPSRTGLVLPYSPLPPSSPMDGSGLVRWQGPISVREDSGDGGARASWIWKNKWLALTGTFLALHEWEVALPRRISPPYRSLNDFTALPPTTVVPLCDVTIIARSDLTPCCLFLETNHGIRRYFSFKHEAQMQEWLDDISCRSPGARSATAFVPYLKDRIQGKVGTGVLAQDNAEDPQDVTGEVNLSREGGIGIPASTYGNGIWEPQKDNWGTTAVCTPPPPRTRPAPSFTSQSPRSFERSSHQIVPAKPAGKTGPGCLPGRPVRELDVEGQLARFDGDISFVAQVGARESVVLLRDIVAIERTDRKPYCLLLETQHRTRMRRYLSFKNEQEMCGWLDDISSRAPSISTEPSRVAPPLGPAGPRPYRASSAWEAQVESSLRPRRGGLPIPPQPRPHPPLPPPRRVRLPYGAP
ncbi:hypothetical protein B0H13DRAFT_2288346 [Mycena leptocephala]|nr:hypothetical protein B0H13DRAFT_2288346 [Mycena leptocephala]